MNRIKAEHLARLAVVYLRQSSIAQVRNNLESQRLQYALAERARALGWSAVETIDADLGKSASGCHKRPGFERMVSLVALGRVGIIFSREASRLSRNDTDWHRLIEVCKITGTLIGDADSVYDPLELDDQLILGIKGTLSTVELGVLRMRMQQGKDSSAARGALRFRLCSGYVHDADGRVVKDPDQRVQDAVALAFSKFRELKNGRQLFVWFHDENIEMPVHQYVDGGLRKQWRLPTITYLVGMIKNPFYAGAYLYGRRPQQRFVINGKVIKRTSKLLRPEDCRVFIPDHHEPYLPWKEYLENMETLRKNAPRTRVTDATTAARAGAGMLVGLLRCGHCGRKLNVNYWGRSGTSPRYTCKGQFGDAGKSCLSFSGTLVEQALQEQIINAISPAGTQASLQAQEMSQAKESEKLQLLTRRVEQLRYEANRAFDQYDQADPKNRLVASELERRWNDKLTAADQAHEDLKAVSQTDSIVNETTLKKLNALGQHFEKAWTSPKSSNQIKKTIIRTLIEELVVTRQEQSLVFILHWAGGTHTELRLHRPTAGSHRKTSADAIEIIAKLAPRHDDGCIAAVLNRHGMTTGQGKPWNKPRVLSARRRYGIMPQFRSTESLGLFSLQKAAEHCGVTARAISRLIKVGLLQNEQTIPYAPFELRKSELDSEPVRTAIERIKTTQELPPAGDVPSTQEPLFK